MDNEKKSPLAQFAAKMRDRDRLPPEPTSAPTPEQQLREKTNRFMSYVRDRDLKDHVHPYMEPLAPHIIQRRKERISLAEKDYPDFPAAYNAYKKR